MSALEAAAAGFALGIAAIAALCDRRSGRIPNWLTLPALLVAPLAYGMIRGAELALLSLTSGILSGLVPYLLFRRGAMGGGDVKLLSALGAVTGFDLLAGIEIQLAAMVVALIGAGVALAWKGELLRTVGNAVAVAASPLLPPLWRRAPCDALAVPVRLGGAIFVATASFAAPHLLLAWSAA